MDNFYTDIDVHFNSLIDKYEKNCELLPEIINLKKSIIFCYENNNRNKFAQYYIINSIKKREFTINSNDHIKSF